MSAKKAGVRSTVSASILMEVAAEVVCDAAGMVEAGAVPLPGAEAGAMPPPQSPASLVPKPNLEAEIPSHCRRKWKVLALKRAATEAPQSSATEAPQSSATEASQSSTAGALQDDGQGQPNECVVPGTEVISAEPAAEMQQQIRYVNGMPKVRYCPGAGASFA